MKRHLAFAFFFAACSGGGSANTAFAPVDDTAEKADSLRTDARVPELGKDKKIVRTAKISMADGIRQAEAANGPTIEAKYELGDDGKLSLSVYPAGKGAGVDAERNPFHELAGAPT